MFKLTRLTFTTTWLVAFLAVSLWFAPRAYAASITVNDTGDTSANDGKCTLREAITNANADNTSGSTDCTAGSGSDTITFAASLTTNGDATITLSQFSTGINTGDFGPTALTVSSNITIQGPATGTNNGIIIQRSSTDTNKFRLFRVTSAGTLTLENLTLQNGIAQGGNGADVTNLSRDYNPGGGAAGLGGAIYNEGTLTVRTSTLTGNSAIGGNGGGKSSGSSTSSTGGGGVGANASGTTGGGPNAGTSGCIATAGNGGGGGGRTSNGNGCAGGFGGGGGGGLGNNNNGGAGGFGGGGGGTRGTAGAGGFGAGDGGANNNNNGGGGGGGGLGAGGAIFNNSGTMTIINTTISGNTATGGNGGGGGSGQGGGAGDGLGGAVFNYNGGTNNRTVTIINSTLANNTVGAGAAGSGTAGNGTAGSAAGGALYNYRSSTGTLTVVLHNNILANTNGTNSDGFNNGTIATGTSTQSNIVETNAGSPNQIATTVIIATNGDPALGELADNGGPTLTQALASTSIARDTGNAANCQATDQRGVTRPLDGDNNGTSLCDIGAFEYRRNTAPSFTKGGDQTAFEDAGAQSVTGWATSISAGPFDEANQTLTFNVTNNNNALFSVQPSVDSTGKLTYTPAPNANGTAIVTISLKDNGGTANGGSDTSASQTFNINVTAVNDAPSFTKGADQTVLEDAVAQSVTGWATSISAGPSDESGQTLTFNVTNNNNALFSVQPSVDSTGKLTYTPAPNANGTALVTISLQDNGGTANGGVDTSASQTFNINVTAVNDAPSFTKGADQTVLEDAGAQSVTGWATSISAGPTNESGQTLTFNVTNNNNALFSMQPSVDATGKLTYTPAPNANGTALVTINLQDNGGTANGGVDTSASQTFNINVTAVNDTPDTSITAQPTNPSNGSASFSFSGTDVEDGSVTNFECALDSDPFAACTSPQSYSNLSEGSHTFNVRAVDSTSAVDPSPATYTWVVDTTPPNTFIDTQPSNPSGSSSATFTFSSSEANSTFVCSLDNAAFTSCTSPKQYTGLSSSSHTFAVQATDAVGNTDASAASYTWLISLNSAPVATNDTPTQVVLGDGNAVLFDVLSNDSDPDAGQTLQIASVQSPSAQNGTVQISSNKASYTAPTHYSGVDTFTYTAQDNDALNPLTSNSATVTVNVVANDARGDCNADGGVDAADFPAIVLEIFDTDTSTDWWKTYTGDFVGSPRGCDANATENSGGASVDASDLTCTVLIFFGDNCGVTNVNAASTGQTATLQVAGNLVGTPSATVSAPIRLTTAGKAVAATAFTFHFDTAHFRFDPTDQDGNGLPDALHLTAPARFTANVQTNAATGEINVALYGATLPLPTLTDGVIATVDLQVVEVSDGQTPAVQLTNASLSDNQGQAIPLTVNNVGGQTSTLVTPRLYLPIVTQ